MFFSQKNGTNADGLWEIYSGVKDIDKVHNLRLLKDMFVTGLYNLYI